MLLTLGSVLIRWWTFSHFAVECVKRELKKSERINLRHLQCWFEIIIWIRDQKRGENFRIIEKNLWSLPICRSERVKRFQINISEIKCLKKFLIFHIFLMSTQHWVFDLNTSKWALSQWSAWIRLPVAFCVIFYLWYMFNSLDFEYRRKHNMWA